MITWRRIAELARYGATGVLGVALNVAIVVVLTKYLQLHYLVSLAISSVFVTIVGFFLNRSWTFRKSGDAIKSEFLRYAGTTAIHVCIGLLACAWLVTSLNMRYWVAVAYVGLVSAPLIYLVHRGWSFGLSWFRDT